MIGFGKNLKNAEPTTIITTLTDNRLIRIDPQEDGFFEKVLNFKPKYNSYFKSEENEVKAFIEAVAEVKDANIDPFYVPIYNPAEVGDNLVTYKNGKKSALGHSYNWWVNTASNMPVVEGRHWHLATEYQYYAFMVWLVNQMIRDRMTVNEAIVNVVIDLTHYDNRLDSHDLWSDWHLMTGSKSVCGVYDLANNSKILACSNGEAGSFWRCGGVQRSKCRGGETFQLASLNYCTDVDNNFDYSVGMLVL